MTSSPAELLENMRVSGVATPDNAEWTTRAYTARSSTISPARTTMLHGLNPTQ